MPLGKLNRLLHRLPDMEFLVQSVFFWGLFGGRQCWMDLIVPLGFEL